MFSAASRGSISACSASTTTRSGRRAHERFVARRQVAAHLRQGEGLGREPAIARHADDPRSQSGLEQHFCHAWRQRHDALRPRSVRRETRGSAMETSASDSHA